VSISIQINGIESLQNRINTIINQMPQEVSASTLSDMNDVIQQSIIECPKDTTALSQSTFVDPPEVSRIKVTITAGYGGKGVKINPKTLQPTTSYMFKVHEEHMSGSKYLERPFEQRKEVIVNNLRARINNLVKG